MARSNHRIFLWCVLAVVGGNYLAQIPYYLHRYSFPHGAPPAWGGTLLLGATLVEVGFYLHNMLIADPGHARGRAIFHLQTGDSIRFVVFGIGYLNLLCGLYFLVFLVLRRTTLVAERPNLAQPRALAG